LKKRAATSEEKKHMDAVAALGCIVCSDNGYPRTPACIHHVGNQGIRASHYETIPLCPTHHQWGGFGVAIHDGRKTWEANFGTERGLLARVNKIVGVKNDNSAMQKVPRILKRTGY
jgi:hypothetical protein